jgi:Tol biopolymer transport system component
VSADGTLVVFSSTSDGLVAGDDDDVANVYLKDLATGEVQLVSRASDVNGVAGEPAHANCFDAAISADGLAVAFVCDGSLAGAADANASRDVYVRNLDTRQTTLVSSRANGTAAGEAQPAPAVAHAGGRTFVAFTSRAGDLVDPPLPPGADRVYRRDVEAARTELASLTTLGTASGGAKPSISADGTRVAFESGIALDPIADDNNRFDVYVRDLADPAAEQTILVSRADAGATVPNKVGNGSSTDAVISGDGRVVAFASAATNLAGGDGDTVADAYLRTLAAGTTRLLSISGATKGTQPSVPTGIDRTGAVVAFRSSANELDAAHVPPNADFYVSRDAGGGNRQLLPVSGGGGVAFAGSDAAAAVSGNGGAVVMTVRDGVTQGLPADADFARVVARDLATLAAQTVSRPPGGAFVNAGGEAFGGSISADGRYVTFTSRARALGGSGLKLSAFLRDTLTGAVTLVSRADGVDGVPLSGVGQEPRVSADGRRVAFEADPPGGGATQVWVRDVPSGRTLLASTPEGAAAGTLGDRDSSGPSISDDGSRVAFVSAANLTADPDGGDRHVFVRDLGAGRTFLADRDGAGVQGNGTASDPAIAGNGGSVAYTTDAGLVADDVDVGDDVYVSGVDGSGTRLANAAELGGGGGAHPSLSRDGRLLAFAGSGDLGFGQLEDAVYVSDLATGALTLASRADGPGGAALDRSGALALSADGSSVAFTSNAAGVAPGAQSAGDRVYERDLARGVTRLISRAGGAAGASVEATGVSPIGGITADGGCVTFGTLARLVPSQTSQDFAGVYLRAVIPNCGRPVPPPPPPPAAKPAVLSGLALRPARFFVAVGRRGGTRILFRLDKASAVTLSFDRLLPGHRKGRRCLTTVRRGRRCTVVRRAGRISLGQSRLRAGANSVRFSGRIGRRALVPGRYRLTATPLHGRPRTVRFTVYRKARR